MSYGVKLKVWGNYACFTRPEMKVERVSYEVMTPSAARGLLEAIYWKPSIRWVIDRIHVLKPIEFTNLRRNELKFKLNISSVRKAMKDGVSPVETHIEDDRTQRAAVLLRNVAYGIEAHFEVLGDEDNNPAKHVEMFQRRARKGQYFHHPYLGCREFPAFFELIEGNFPPAIDETRPLGWMLHDIDFADGMTPLFFNPELIKGIIQIPLPTSSELRK